MKNRATAYLKHLVSVLVAVVKSKSLAVKSKTSALKTRLMILRLLHNKKVLKSAISQKIHALMGGENRELLQAVAAEDDSRHQALVPYNADASDEAPLPPLMNSEATEDDDSEDDEYPDLRHSLFDTDEGEEEDDDGLGDCTGSVIDLVRNSRDNGSEFNLEEEIDHVADVFIRRFHKQMRIEKQQSIRRYREMLERSV